MPESAASPSRAGADPQEVDAFERMLGRSLPDYYRRFLLSKNGGEPEPGYWHCGPTRDDPRFGWTPLSVWVGEFFGLVDEPKYASLRWHREVYADRIPESLLPIGCDPAGNVIALGLDDDDRDTVWFWDHEREVNEGEAPWWDNLLRLAPSFESFLTGLVDEDGLQRRIDNDVQASVQSHPPRP